MNGGLSRSTQHFILNGKVECMQMRQRRRWGFTTAEKTELWDRWLRFQPVEATQALNLSAGVSNSKVCLGRSFS